jgi:hypothetical protein
MNSQQVTGGIFYCRDSGCFKVCATNNLSCILTDLCFEIGNKNIPPTRYLQAKKIQLNLFEDLTSYSKK